MSRKEVYELVFCLLEIVGTREVEGKPSQITDIAEELERPVAHIKAAKEIALKEGLIKCVKGTLKLTEKGRAEVQKHRESYLHRKYVHYTRFLGGIARFFEGKVSNWREHWRHKHGFNNNSLNQFYRDLQDFKGRIEDTLPLTDLREGEKGIVTFVMTPHRYHGHHHLPGFVRRLAEMGLTPNTEVKVVRRSLFRGPIEVEVRGVSLALGYGLASKVLVKPAAREPNEG
jgi:Fe2+ transport system protein FeoA